MRLLFELLIVFAKIGLFTFGGGYAMLPLIEDICVEKKKWITHDEMMNITVIAEATPGPIAINCATYVGMKKKGLSGAVASTIGVIIPSFIIILIISLFFDRLLEIKWVHSAFCGIKIAVSVLIVDAAIKMIRKMKKKPLTVAVLTTSCLAMLLINIFSLNISTIVLILISAILGMSVALAKKQNNKKANKDAS